MKLLTSSHHHQIPEHSFSTSKESQQNTTIMHSTILLILVAIVTSSLAEQAEDDKHAIRHLHHKICKQFWKKFLQNFDGDSEDLFLDWYTTSKKETSTFPTIAFNEHRELKYPKITRDADGAPVIDHAHERGEQTGSLLPKQSSMLLQKLLDGVRQDKINPTENVQAVTDEHTQENKDNRVEEVLKKRHHGKTHHHQLHSRHESQTETQTAS
ncbi:uncharacterized protein LOC117124064 [Anneissia japonica]|uniref:uncharacterized protein LOC117124064 n=1 Tax=Anneissia japonica TaxID=1529436 RepID=UPI001425683C|nr:uncharacterized protein LOC117124064 [Anneissia japonica]